MTIFKLMLHAKSKLLFEKADTIYDIMKILFKKLLFYA